MVPRSCMPRVRPNGLRFYVLPRSIGPRTCMPPLPHGAARAAKWSQFYVLPRSIVPRPCMLPRPMVPRVRPNGLSSLCCRVPWCLACGQMVSVLCVAALHSAAHLYAAAPPWCRACGQMVSVLCVAAFHGSAQFYMLPRPMLPRSSLCCRVPWCRALSYCRAP